MQKLKTLPRKNGKSFLYEAFLKQTLPTTKDNLKIRLADAKMRLIDGGELELALNMSIGELLEELNKYDDQKTIKFSNNKYLNGYFGSYRGYYEDLYIGKTDENTGLNTVGELKKILNAALKQGVMYGYKGGEFPITRDTLVWFADYGNRGEAIISILKLEDQLLIVVKSEGDG